MDLEQAIELQGLTLPHQLPSAEDYDIVCYERDRRLEHGRHGRTAANEAKVLRRVTLNHLECAREDWPKGNAEGAIERGHAILEPAGL